MNGRRGIAPAGRADLAVLLGIFGSAIAVGIPLFRGGATTYLDNPVHLAEISSLATEGGWSSIAFCGFALDQLHSPLFFGGLAMLSRFGLPIEALYASLASLGFAAPALALYFLVRRHLALWCSATLAFALLVQRPAIAGISSAFGGMWTFYLAAATALVLLVRLARPTRAAPDVAWIGGLIGFIGLTHAFVGVGVMWLGVIHVVVRLFRRELRVLLFDLAGAALGGGIAAAYWLPAFLGREGLVSFRWDLPFAQSLALLALPIDMHAMLAGRPWVSLELGGLDTLPLVLPLLGIMGVLRKPRALITIYAATWAGLLLVLLALAPHLPAALLGPVSWRQVYFVRAALAVAALPWLMDRFPATCEAIPTRHGTVLMWATVPAAILLAFFTGKPLRAEVPAIHGSEMSEVRALWQWLKAHHDESWGRVYIQDTFLAPPLDRALAQSHVLSLTAREASVQQLGAYYRLMPYRVSRWTKSDQGTLFGKSIQTAAGLEALAQNLIATNCTHVVLSVPEQAPAMSGSPGFRPVHQVGRFTVFQRDMPARFALPTSEGVEAHTTHYASGAIELDVVSKGRGSLFVAEQYHPFWRMSGAPGAQLKWNKLGLLSIEDLPAGRSAIKLRYRAPRLPLFVSAACVLAWCAAVIAIRRKREVGSRP